MDSSKVILGAPDAITARFCCDHLGANYIWASSFVLSAMLGLRDEGMINMKSFIPLLNGIISGAKKPVLLDFDIGGRDITEFQTNLADIKSLGLGGVCIEDEAWPKKNAMLSGVERILIDSSIMAKKISSAKEELNSKSLVIARSHSLIAKEPIDKLQERINQYQDAGADVICVHYTDNDWDWYKNEIKKININTPLLLILSNFNSIPTYLDNFDYVLFPNQIYRTMLYPILNLKSYEVLDSFDVCKMVDNESLFSIVEDINAKK